jgi:hypothetical protein
MAKLCLVPTPIGNLDSATQFPIINNTGENLGCIIVYSDMPLTSSQQQLVEYTIIGDATSNGSTQ